MSSRDKMTMSVRVFQFLLRRSPSGSEVQSLAAHTWRRASILVVFVVFSVLMHSFAGLIRRMPPQMFSDTAITDRHSDTTIVQLRAHWVRISWSIGSEK